MLHDRPLPDLLDAFSSSDPTPGGGSAAALLGALGASLLAMVAGLPKSKSNMPAERAALNAARTQLLELRRTLTELIDRDAGAYDRVVAAYRLPKSSDDEKMARSNAVQAALQYATEVPLETLTACGQVIEIGRTVAASGNPSAISDIAVGLQTLMTGMSGALLNVQINLGSVKNAAFVQQTTAAVRRSIESAGEVMREIMSAPEFAELHRQSAILLGEEHARPV
jgi:formiminotetrahydrofolate cyclodeaminase